MKLSRTAWLILGIGVFAIAIGSLFWVYLEQRGEQQRLDDSLSVAQATLPTLVSERANLESQLSQSESELAQARSLLYEVKASFPESVESIEYDEALFDIADDCNLKITNLTASEPSDEEVESITYSDEEVESVTYSVASFTVEVEGTVPHILDFINTITTDEYFINATIERVDMQVPEPGEGKEKPSATIDLIIYGYQGE